MLAVDFKDHTGKRMCYTEGSTGDNGLFSILVKGEYEHQFCETYTFSSPASCNIPTDSNRGPVFLTHIKGINSDDIKNSHSYLT